jgi:hypothetical protein
MANRLGPDPVAGNNLQAGGAPAGFRGKLLLQFRNTRFSSGQNAPGLSHIQH